MSVRVDPALARILNLPAGASAETVVSALLRKGLGPIVAAHNRAVERSRVTKIVVEDGDPEKAGKQRAEINPHISSSDDWARAGAKIGAFVMNKPATHGALLADEARLMLIGAPRGPLLSRSLDAPDNDDGISGVDDLTLSLLAPGALEGKGKGLFGIDDAIILGVGVPLLIALIPVVLPFLFEVGSKAIAVISGAAAPAPAGGGGGPPAQSEAANPIDSFADSIGIGSPGKNDTFLVLGVVAALVVGYVILRRRARAG